MPHLQKSVCIEIHRFRIYSMKLIQFFFYNRFDTHRSLRAHCKYQNRNKCKVCTLTFCTLADLTTHKKQECKGRPIDTGSMKDDNALTTSYRTANPAKCDFCEKSFSNKSNLRYHQRHAHSLKNFHSCDLCGRQFAYKKQLVVHHLKHFGIPNCEFECCLCHHT